MHGATIKIKDSHVSVVNGQVFVAVFIEKERGL